jgi:abequosyltransferase
MKKLTIAIPTYNRKEAITSKVNEISSYITNQNLSEQIELLIVDNCSSEYNIYEILGHEKETSFVNVQKNSGNIGAGSNFLRCLELANSEYVWLLGDDEILDLSYLENLATTLQDKDCYLLPHNESYAEKATYFGNFSSIDELFDNFWNLASFFILSIYVF